jgi:hypothetical protein
VGGRCRIDIIRISIPGLLTQQDVRRVYTNGECWSLLERPLKALRSLYNFEFSSNLIQLIGAEISSNLAATSGRFTLNLLSGHYSRVLPNSLFYFSRITAATLVLGSWKTGWPSASAETGP